MELETVGGIAAATALVVSFLKKGFGIHGRMTQATALLVAMALAISARATGLSDASWGAAMIYGLLGAVSATGLYEYTAGEAKGESTK